MNSLNRFFSLALLSPLLISSFSHIYLWNDFSPERHRPREKTSCATCAVNLFGESKAKTNVASERAEEILQKSLLAYGGESRILSLKTGSYEYQVESQGTSAGAPIVVKTYFKDEQSFRSEASGDNLNAVTVLNGEQGWVKVGDTSLMLSKKEITPMRSGMVAQLRPDLLLLSFPKRRFTGQIEEDGRHLNQVEVSGFIEGEYVRGRLSMDAETSLLHKYEYEIEREFPKGKGVIKGEERYLSYAEKDGFKYPAEVLSKQAQKTSRLKLLNVFFNPKLSDDLFQNPAPPITEKK